MIVDLFLVYQFIRRLSTPFVEWDAYDLGIIDENGKQLIKRRDFTTRDQKDAFGIFDIMIMKLKRLLEKVPGGSTRIGSYAAALYLIKEHDELQFQGQGEMLKEEHLQERLNFYIKYVESSNRDIDALFENAFEEDAPANSAGSGNIAGIGVGPQGEPGMSPKHKKRKPLKRFKDTPVD